MLIKYAVRAGKAAHARQCERPHPALPWQGDQRAVRRKSRQLVCHVSSKLETGHPIWAIGHRRGGEVHMYITSRGTTLPGRPQSHAEDQANGTRGQMRPCPRVLNDWTLMQPAIDDANCRRQNILAFEKRFVTRTFSFCLLTTVISMSYANAFKTHTFFVLVRAADGED
eukprot:2604960-Pleurochrysis_carterae.AAC.2